MLLTTGPNIHSTLLFNAIVTLDVGISRAESGDKESFNEVHKGHAL